jgi:hypothetical protein
VSAFSEWLRITLAIDAAPENQRQLDQLTAAISSGDAVDRWALGQLPDPRQRARFLDDTESATKWKRELAGRLDQALLEERARWGDRKPGRDRGAPRAYAEERALDLLHRFGDEDPGELLAAMIFVFNGWTRGFASLAKALRQSHARRRAAVTVAQ